MTDSGCPHSRPATRWKLQHPFPATKSAFPCLGLHSHFPAVVGWLLMYGDNQNDCYVIFYKPQHHNLRYWSRLILFTMSKELRAAVMIASFWCTAWIIIYSSYLSQYSGGFYSSISASIGTSRTVLQRARALSSRHDSSVLMPGMNLHDTGYPFPTFRRFQLVQVS